MIVDFPTPGGPEMPIRKEVSLADLLNSSLNVSSITNLSEGRLDSTASELVTKSRAEGLWVTKDLTERNGSCNVNPSAIENAIDQISSPLLLS